MKLNALQCYLLKVYAVALILLVIFVPTYNVYGETSFNLLLLKFDGEINIAFMLVEILALTLATFAVILATNDNKKK
jgi:hypothetical protein